MGSQPKTGQLTVQEQSRGDELIVTLSGRLGIHCPDPLLSDLRARVARRKPATLTLDLAGVEYLDSAGALGLGLVEKEAAEAGIAVRSRGLSQSAERIKEMIAEHSAITHNYPPKPKVSALEQIGAAIFRLGDDMYIAFSFIGDLFLALVDSLRHPRRVRWGDILHYMETVGVDGLPIVGLISFLMGLIMAFMSSLQLQQFGASIYVASLVGIAMVRELGPIFTAILVAGRSGSGFAAEIGTMVVNEEVDALVAMGYNPYQFLALPKIIAAVLMVPLLTIFADVAAIIGGMIIGVSVLDLTVYGYVEQTIDSISIYGLVTSLVKSAVFGLLIATVGCQRGFRVSGGAMEVGAATTRAVVSSIFLIILTDSIFAVVLYFIW